MQSKLIKIIILHKAKQSSYFGKKITHQVNNKRRREKGRGRQTLYETKRPVDIEEAKMRAVLP